MRLLRSIGFLIIVLVGAFLLRNQVWHIPSIGSSIKTFSLNFNPSNIENNGTQIATKLANDIKENLPPPLRGPTATSSPSSAASGALSASGIITVTNKERATNGHLPALGENAKLDAAANAKLKDMFAKQYFEHTSPSGIGPADLAKAQGYEYILIGENLALGDFKNNQDLLTAWMNSPGHRANILNSRYIEMGAAVSKGMYQGHETYLAVQEFGLPLTVCPSIDASLEAKINTEKSDLDAKNADLQSRQNDINNSSPKYGDAYNAKVTAYNNLVTAYNAEIQQTKNDINIYNAEVKAFNNCVNS